MKTGNLSVLMALLILPLPAQFRHDANPPRPEQIRAFSPAGTLYDNDVSNMITSLASQNSTGTLTVRSADDFLLPGVNCPSGRFSITRIRVQMVQYGAAPQPFGLEIYADNGLGTGPTPADAI